MSENKDKDKDGDKGKDKKRPNPWGTPVHKGPWSGSGNLGSGINGSGIIGGAGGQPPNLDDLLRAAKKSLGNDGGDGISLKLIGIGLLALIAIWLLSGFYMVSPGENAVIQRFGALERVQKIEGLGYHMPWPIESAKIINTSTVQALNIGFIETKSGVKKPVYEESLMLTSDRNIINMFMTVQWHIKSAEDYIFRVADVKDTLKKVSESALREVVGQTKMWPLMKKRDTASTSIKNIIQSNLDEYKSGIEIDSVSMDEVDVHPDAQSAFQDVQSAKQDGDNAKNLAKAYANDVVPKAKGKASQIEHAAEAYKESVIARAKGDANRFESVYSAYLKGKTVTRTRMYIETMEQVISNADTIVMDDGAGRGALPYLSLDKVDNKGAKK